MNASAPAGTGSQVLSRLENVPPTIASANAQTASTAAGGSPSLLEGGVAVSISARS